MSPRTQEAETEISEFKVILVCRTSFRTVRTI